MCSFWRPQHNWFYYYHFFILNFKKDMCISINVTQYPRYHAFNTFNGRRSENIICCTSPRRGRTFSNIAVLKCYMKRKNITPERTRFPPLIRTERTYTQRGGSAEHKINIINLNFPLSFAGHRHLSLARNYVWYHLNCTYNYAPYKCV